MVIGASNHLPSISWLFQMDLVINHMEIWMLMSIFDYMIIKCLEVKLAMISSLYLSSLVDSNWELTMTYTLTHPTYSNPPHKQINAYTQTPSTCFSVFFSHSTFPSLKQPATIRRRELLACVCVWVCGCVRRSVRLCVCQTWDCQRLNLISYSLAAPPSPSLPTPSFPYPLPPRRKPLIYFA